MAEATNTEVAFSHTEAYASGTPRASHRLATRPVVLLRAPRGGTTENSLEIPKVVPDDKDALRKPSGVMCRFRVAATPDTAVALTLALPKATMRTPVPETKKVDPS